MKYPCNIQYPLTQNFGENAQIYKRFGLKGHNGLDYGLPTGVEIVSPHAGTIIEATNDPQGYGMYLKIENSQEGSVLAHLQNFFVKVGDNVSEGQSIAVSNNTGFSTGAHLHWGYYKFPRDRSNGFNGFIDQLPFLKEPLKMTLDDETFKKLVHNSTQWDSVVKYLEIVTDPKDTSFEDVQRVIGGIKSHATDMQTQLTNALAELSNLSEKISRREAELLQSEELRQNLSKNLNHALAKLSGMQPTYEGALKEKQGVIDELAKEKGSLISEIATLKVKLDNCEKGIQRKNLLEKIVKFIENRFLKR